MIGLLGEDEFRCSRRGHLRELRWYVADGGRRIAIQDLVPSARCEKWLRPGAPQRLLPRAE